MGTTPSSLRRYLDELRHAGYISIQRRRDATAIIWISEMARTDSGFSGLDQRVCPDMDNSDMVEVHEDPCDAEAGETPCTQVGHDSEPPAEPGPEGVSPEIQELAVQGVKQKTAHELVEKFPRRRIRAVLAAAADRGDLHNAAGWIVTGIERDWKLARRYYAGSAKKRRLNFSGGPPQDPAPSRPVLRLGPGATATAFEEANFTVIRE